MAITAADTAPVLLSYGQDGKKLSFANWISNLSPTDTPFTSMTGKEAINQTLFQWQTDTLNSVGKNAVKEGAAADDSEVKQHQTLVFNNVTQILRKVVKVSDTANVTANYGRGAELQYQMEKAGKEIKRDLEFALLQNGAKVAGSSSIARETAGFQALVGVDAAGAAVPVDPDTKGKVVVETASTTTPTEEELFDLTLALYTTGSKANVIMFHPKFAKFFSSLQEKTGTGNRLRMFENTPKLSVYVSEIVDPLGQAFRLIPNRFMPEDAIYVFNPSDWTQMVLRAPARTKLAKDGSYEKWMIEMEVGLRHRNPYASGVLKLKK